MYLAVQMRKIIDAPFVAAIKSVKGKPAVAEVIADPNAIPSVVGKPAVPGVVAVEGREEVAEVSHLKRTHTYIETDVASLAAATIRDPLIKYYAIVFDDDAEPTLKRVKEKEGKRRKATAKELFELTDEDGNVIAETVLP